MKKFSLAIFLVFSPSLMASSTPDQIPTETPPKQTTDSSKQKKKKRKGHFSYRDFIRYAKESSKTEEQKKKDNEEKIKKSLGGGEFNKMSGDRL